MAKRSVEHTGMPRTARKVLPIYFVVQCCSKSSSSPSSSSSPLLSSSSSSSSSLLAAAEAKSSSSYLSSPSSTSLFVVIAFSVVSIFLLFECYSNDGGFCYNYFSIHRSLPSSTYNGVE